MILQIRYPLQLFGMELQVVCIKFHMLFNFFISSFACIHFIIIHSGNKPHRILNWTEVPDALKEFMLHNYSGFPENKR